MKMMMMMKKKVPTADSLTVLEDLIDLSVHLDELVSVLLDLEVPGIHPLLDPECERLADDAVDDIDDILPKEDENVFNSLNPNILEVKNNIDLPG